MQGSTEFTNQNISLTELPSIMKLEQHPLAINYAKTNSMLIIFIATLLVIIIGVIEQQFFFTIEKSLSTILSHLLWIIPPLFLFIGIIKNLADKQKFYALRQEDISFSSGLIFKKIVTQPILRIQHVELKRGPIERKIGLATIQVFSAGGAMHTFEIPGLVLDQAESIRQFILDHKDINQHD